MFYENVQYSGQSCAMWPNGKTMLGNFKFGDFKTQNV